MRRKNDRSRQVYEVLLELYPAKYRQEFGEEMRYVFSELLNDARPQGRYAILRLWARTITDTGWSAATQHVMNHKERKSMQKNTNDKIMKNGVFGQIALMTFLLLLVPLLAIQFNTGIDWTLLDFVVMGLLLFSVGSLFVVIARRTSKKHRLLVAAGCGILFFYLWIELAVGIFFTWGS
jgi:hypothetical protein